MNCASMLGLNKDLALSNSIKIFIVIEYACTNDLL